jgi:CheY-like chemotaxis protein
MSCLVEKPPPGAFVFIEVSDNGCGMESEIQKRLFDPFFTTKFTGRGLGMAATQGIVRAHNGVLLLESEKGAGTTFRILFPVAAVAKMQAQESYAVTPAGISLATAKKRMVLVVDDEPQIRSMMVEYVHHLGFEPVEAGNGEEALEHFRRQADDIVFVILDLTMPTMDGVTAFHELLKIRPDVRVILSSGYSVHSVAGQFPGVKPAGFIPKPFQLHELQAKIVEIMA